MRLSTSTGDFSGYVHDVADKIALFKGTKFKYINLEQTGDSVRGPFGEDGDAWERLAEQWGEVGAASGLTYVVSHAPCLNAFAELNDGHYQRVVRAIRRSIEICGRLGIKRTVVHASSNPTFSFSDVLTHNRRFYTDLLDTMEKHGVTVMVENMHELPYPSFSTGEEIRDFLDSFNHPLLAACWDTAHWNLNGRARETDQYDHIVALGKHLKGLHVSDNLGGSAHHHSWPFAGTINFDAVLQGLIDVGYDGYFNFEASYTLLHHTNPPRRREAWVHDGQTVSRLLDPSIELKQRAVDLLYDIGKHMLSEYGCFEP